MKYVTEEEFAAICTKQAKRVRHDAKVSALKKRWREGADAELTLAQKLEKLKAIDELYS